MWTYPLSCSTCINRTNNSNSGSSCNSWHKTPATLTTNPSCSLSNCTSKSNSSSSNNNSDSSNSSNSFSNSLQACTGTRPFSEWAALEMVLAPGWRTASLTLAQGLLVSAECTALGAWVALDSLVWFALAESRALAPARTISLAWAPLASDRLLTSSPTRKRRCSKSSSANSNNESTIPKRSSPARVRRTDRRPLWRSSCSRASASARRASSSA
mmetsp:Transcript_3477/g.10187  ORF Transcript_3477/g.10187 Transcript_3477/m.10187 type:complete len:214 (+) Transcript_3477:867-1508(+)